MSLSPKSKIFILKPSKDLGEEKVEIETLSNIELYLVIL